MKGVLLRVAAIVPLLWALGFAAFVVFLPGPAPDAIVTDAIVVPTGGPGRIARGAALLEARKATRMLISGADRTASAASIARTNGLGLVILDLLERERHRVRHILSQHTACAQPFRAQGSCSEMGMRTQDGGSPWVRALRDQ